MSLVRFLALAAAFALIALPALAHDVTLGALTISNAWTRATPPNAPAGGGFLTIVNNGSDDDALISATAGFFAKAELHEMAVVDNVMTMREQEDGIRVPAGGRVEFRPGALHVMFMGLKGPLKQGDTVTVTLVFEKAGSIEVPFIVERIGARDLSEGHGSHAAN